MDTKLRIIEIDLGYRPGYGMLYYVNGTILRNAVPTILCAFFDGLFVRAFKYPNPH